MKWLLLLTGSILWGQDVVKNIQTDYGAACDGVTNDDAKFITWRDAMIAYQTSVSPSIPYFELDIPSACNTAFLSGGSSTYIVRGLKHVLIKGLGTGATRGTLSDGNGTGNGAFLGGNGQVQDNTHSSRLTANVSAGGLTAAVTDGTIFTASAGGHNRYIYLGGVDLQGYGFPTNHAVFEFNKLNSISINTLTLNNFITADCKTTWPVYNTGSAFEIDQGGACTAYMLAESWDIDVEYRNLIIDFGGVAQSQIYGNGRSVTFTNVVTPHGAVIPSQNLTWTATDCDFSTNTIEMDKAVGTVTMTRTTVHRIDFQSASIKSFIGDHVTVTSYFHGTPVAFICTDCDLTDFRPGAIAYGNSSSVVCANCVLPSVTAGGFSETSANSVYTLTAGVFKIANAHGPVTWASPGAKLVFSGQYSYEGSPFTVTDITQDASFTYVTTSLAGGFPTLPLQGGTRLDVSTHPAPIFRCPGCIGSVDALGFPQVSVPWDSYTRRLYSGNILGQSSIPIFGTLLRISINVTTPYTGVRSTLSLGLDGPFVVNSSGVAVTWTPGIDLKTSGERIIFAALSRGSVGADSFSSPGAGTWLVPGQITPTASADISGESSTVYPSVTIEIITDQGVVGSGDFIQRYTIGGGKALVGGGTAIK